MRTAGRSDMCLICQPDFVFYSDSAPFVSIIFYTSRNPDFAEEKGYALTNTAWTYSLMAVTDEKKFDENNVYTVAVQKEKDALK